MAASRNYRLASIWLVNFEPAMGTEIRKTRPAMIISGTLFNQRRKVTVLPITSSAPDNRLLPVVVPIEPNPTNGLTTDSFIVCIDLMTFDKQRLVKQLGILSTDKIRQVKSILSESNRTVGASPRATPGVATRVDHLLGKFR